MATRSFPSMTTLSDRCVVVAMLFAVLAVSAAFVQPAWSQAAGAAPPKQDDGLQRRVQQLEEQLVDMQVVIGTLETLGRSNISAGAAPLPADSFGAAPTGGADPRVGIMETQIRALTAQVEQLSRQLREQSTQRPRSDATGGAPVAPVGQWSAPPQPLSPAATQPAGAAKAPNAGDFGATAVAPSATPSVGNAGWPKPPQSTANLAKDVASQKLGDVGAKSLYETAYGYLLQQDYGAAQSSFGDFLTRYPSDPLAGNAQFWLGESFFVRGQYKNAAGAFLKGYEQYGKSAKAPDSLLKLAMSLERLGQKDAACSSLSELNTRFPKASPLVKKRASAERRRVGC